MSGYARFHRSLIGHAAFRNDAEAMAFAYMVLRASWKPVRVRYKGKALSLNRGQLAMSVRDLADAMDRDKGWIERLLKRLKSETMVETVSETGVLVITICNYEKYQAGNDNRETGSETQGETRARQTQDTEQVREEDKKKEDTLPSGSVARATRENPFPRPDWAEPSVWSDLLANRRTKKLPNTATAYRKLIRDIEALTDPQWPPGRVLEACTARGWGAIYGSIKEDGNATARRNCGTAASRGDGFSNALREMSGDWSADYRG